MLTVIQQNKKWLWFLGVFFWVGFVIFSFFLYDAWLIPGPHGTFHWVGMDFVPYWVGVRSMLEGHSPYQIETTRLIQSTLMGGMVKVGQDPMMFVYPPILFLPLLPFALLPLRLAIATWVGTILFCLLVFIGYISIQWGNKNPWRVALWGIALAVGLLPYMAIAGTKGQLGLICLAFLFLAKHISPKKSFLAGVLLTFALLKPTLSAIPVTAFLLWAFREHKYKFLAGFLITLVILFGASWMAVGNWFPDYLNLLEETGGAPILWSYVSLTSPWNYLFIVAFLCIMIYALIYFFKSRLLHPLVSSSIIVGMALLPMRWIYDLAAGFLTLADIRQPRGWTAGFVGLALFLPWMVIIFPEPARWNTMLVGLPVLWALVWLMNLSSLKNVAAGEETVVTKDY